MFALFFQNSFCDLTDRHDVLVVFLDFLLTVIKFRVCNARINQEGGDVAGNYFDWFEFIGIIRDARFQPIMLGRTELDEHPSR